MEVELMDTVLFIACSDKYRCAERIDGARRFAERRGWSVQVVERKGRKLDMRGILGLWKPIGVIAECGGWVPEIGARVLGRIPVVYLDEDPKRLRGHSLNVVSDTRAVGELAARELLALELSHYAIVGWYRPLFWSEERGAAFKDAIRLHGGTCDMFRCRAGESEAHRMRRLGEWLKSLPKPCGVFAVYDVIGDEIMQIAAANGIKVPEDMAVIGVDDDQTICELTNPPMTSIKMDHERAGFLCAQLLDEKIRNPGLSDIQLTFGPMYVKRRTSTRRFAKSDWRVFKAIEYIRRTACDGIDVDMVAAVMGLARRQAEIVFRRQTGHAIYDEIVNVRLENVKALLHNPAQSIEAIAPQCGWPTSAGLRKVFAARYGMSMREWRKRCSAS